MKQNTQTVNILSKTIMTRGSLSMTGTTSGQDMQERILGSKH